MPRSFQQTDTLATYTGPGSANRPTNAGGTIALACIGTPGSAVQTVTLDALAKDVWSVAFDIPIPTFTLWHGGDWVVRLHVVSSSPAVTWHRCTIDRLNGSGTFQSRIGEAIGLAQVFTCPTVVTARIRGEAQYLRVYGDRVLIVCSFANQGNLPPWYLAVKITPSPFSFIADQLIDSPFSGGN